MGVPIQSASIGRVRRPIRTLGSLWFAAVILVLLLVAMAAGTVYELLHGSEQALLVFYQAWWFKLLLWLLAGNVTLAAVLRYPYTRGHVGFLTTHGAIILILAGALVTHYFGIDGQLSLEEGKTAGEFVVRTNPETATDGPTRAPAYRTVSLGFNVTLNRFTVGRYPGESRPRSFESQVTITDPVAGRTQARVISMNHPTKYGGYTFFQSSYRMDGERATSVLSVARDPGQPIVFTGYIALLAGMLIVMATRISNRRRSTHAALLGVTGGPERTIDLLRARERCITNGSGVHAMQAGHEPRHAVSKPLVAFGLGLFVSSMATAVELPKSLDLEGIRRLSVQHDGRWPPLDTVARDVVKSVTGNEFFQGHDPVLLFLSWTFDPATWMNEPLVRIRNAELRTELGLSAVQVTYSYTELLNHPRLRLLTEELYAMDRDRKLNPLQSKVSDIHEKLMLLYRVFMGKVIRPIPEPKDLTGAWLPIGRPQADDPLPLSTTKAAWGRLRETFLADDAAGFKTASTDLTEALAALPAAYRANARLLDTELRYNRLRPFRSAWMVMLAATALAAVAMGVRRRWFDAIVLVGVLAGFAVVTYGLSMRWQIAGRIPASNMFESLLFLGWGVGAFAVVAIFVFRERLVPLTAAGMSATALFLADVLPLDPFIRPIAPVLMDTVWMSIHVPVIMVSYSVLALAVLIAHVQLVVMAAAPAKRSWIESIDNLHYWYVPVGSLLLAAGIITGSMWAASSWGRYWGWDPKEVWSLVALLGYLTILHVRVNPERVPFWAYVVGAAMMAALLSIVVVKLAPITSGKALGLSAAAGAMILLVTGGGPFSTAAKSILCFWLIIMTYVGVNYVLGAGLHSYGFGTGAVARSMFRLGGGDLAFVALCCVVYLLRRALERGRSATSQVVLAT